ncbi:MAG: YbhB/YbcL family Raf kinase inhibitor-like protein [Parachlamydiaceae bacterium]|nr:YbhB/YbcL family Raf kinase inhibitor-like protein [Parachlamydiaceae bacterium]
MKLTSSAFKHQGTIPFKYAYEGEDLSPPLTIQEIPAGTKSLALIVDDPDAPQGTFDHWITWNLPANTWELQEGASVTMQGQNHYGNQQYGGPHPPPGAPHRYFFKLYALDTELKLAQGISKEELEEAMEGHILGRAELVGVYQR